MSAPVVRLGGTSESRAATAEIQAIADKIGIPGPSETGLVHRLQGQIPADQTWHLARQVKSQLEEKENKKYPTFKATEYKSQVVQGINYFIKVQVADDDFVHLRVFESLPQENKALALDSYQTNKTKQDELAYF